MDTLGVVLFIAVFAAVVFIFVALARGELGWAAGLFFMWPIALPLYIVHLIRLPVRRRQAAEEARRVQEEASRQHHREKQLGYYDEMVRLGEGSLGRFESTPAHLDSAEKWLDQAEDDFAERAFTPFWDSIENAVKCLANLDEGVRYIENNSSRYTELVRKYDETPPQFPLARQSVEKLGIGTATAERMQAIVRKAQRDFQFASIYVQRRTNQILIAGFENLAQALEQMTWQIRASIDDLAGSVGVMTSTLNESMRAIQSRMGDIAETITQHHTELSKEASERVAREQRALGMLDNIQRGRRPFP